MNHTRVKNWNYWYKWPAMPVILGLKRKESLQFLIT